MKNLLKVSLEKSLHGKITKRGLLEQFASETYGTQKRRSKLSKGMSKTWKKQHSR